MINFIILPLTGALTGGLIVSLFYKLLFHPAEPVKIPFFAYQFQGIIPMKRKAAAQGLGQIIESQLLCAVTEHSGSGPALYHSMKEAGVCAAREKVAEKLPGFLPYALKNKIADYAADVFSREMDSFVDEAVYKLRHDQSQAERIGEGIEALIDSYDLSKLEKDLSSSSTLRWIKTGAEGLGLLSGLLQAIILFLIN